MLSKGSNQRPTQVPKDQYDRNWERIFSKSVKESDKKREKNGNVR